MRYTTYDANTQTSATVEYMDDGECVTLESVYVPTEVEILGAAMHGESDNENY